MTDISLGQAVANNFETLLIKIRDKQLDYNKIENIEKINDFEDFKEWFNHSHKNLNISSDQLQGLIIEQTRESNVFHTNSFLKILEKFYAFLEEEKYTHYFCPIYNLESNLGEIQIQNSTDSIDTDQIKIRKIKLWEKEYLNEVYENWIPAQVQIPLIEYCLIISVNTTLQDEDRGVVDKMQEVLDKFRLCKNGDIKFGGCYEFKDGSEWNPHRTCQLITYEKAGMYSREQYKFNKNEADRFLSLLKKINTRYPINDEKYSTYFGKIIKRFSGTVDKKNSADKLTDLVICMETLLVAGAGGNLHRFKQNSAMLLGNNFAENIKIENLMDSFYNYRSGQVHELEERQIKLNGKNIPIEEGLRIMRDYTKRAILKIILLSQDPEFEKLTHKKLISKINESIYDLKLQEKFQDLENEISI